MNGKQNLNSIRIFFRFTVAAGILDPKNKKALSIHIYIYIYKFVNLLQATVDRRSQQQHNAITKERFILGIQS